MHDLVPTPEDITSDEFQTWLRLLIYLHKDKKAPVARLLRLSLSTIVRWEYGRKIPTSWWWRAVFRDAVEITVDRMRHLISQTPRDSAEKSGWIKRVRVAEERLSKLPADVYFVRQATRAGDTYRRAVEFLQENLPPGKKVMYWRLERAMHNKGHSLKMISRASADLGVQRGKDGYQGKSWWRMPSVEASNEE